MDMALLAVLAAVLRGWHLGRQSVWLDEFFSAAYVDRPSLLQCLRDQRVENWEMVPFYYALQYGWAQIVGAHPLSLRCLSVLMGVACVPVIFWLGWRSAGRWGGWVAAGCLALSPLQIFHAQGLRPYALVALLGLLSMGALLQYSESGRRRWFWANAVANILLLWTHLFTVFLLLPQGLHLLLTRRVPRRARVSWFLIHGLMLLPVLLWVATIRVIPDPGLRPPSLPEFATALLAGDTGPVRSVLHAPGIREAFQSSPVLNGLMEASVLSQWALTILFGLAVLAMAARGAWRLRTARAAAPDGGPPARDTLLLLAWCVLPPMALFLLAQAWSPRCFAERYFIYSLPALYLLAGVAAASMRHAAPRIAFTAALLLALAFQTVLAVALPMRTDFLGVARLLKTEAAPDDAVLVPDYNVRRVLAFNMGPSSIRLADNQDTLPAFRDSLEHVIAKAEPTWLIVSHEAEQAEIANRLKALLAERKIPCSEAVFPGMQTLFVYRFTPRAAQ